MVDIFISFKTSDTEVVRPIYDGLRQSGYEVFWSNDIPKGATDYQKIIKKKLIYAPVVVVVWTTDSCSSQPVAQECAQAEKNNKLFQILLDQLEPMDIPMEANFKSQKTDLTDWRGGEENPEWIKLLDAIKHKVSNHVPGKYLSDTADDTKNEAFEKPVKIDAKILHETKGWFIPGKGQLEWFSDFEDGPELVVIPAGELQLPSPSTSNAPCTRLKTTRDFAIGRYAITRGQFRIFADEVNRDMRGVYCWNGKRFVSKQSATWQQLSFHQSDTHPATGISWEDAKAYLEWLSDQTNKHYRLPTETEWEYSARAMTTTDYWWGDSLTSEEANYDPRSISGQHQNSTFLGRTVPVGLFQGNPWGLYNVHGNVWEWCNDQYSASYPDNEQSDSLLRVIRGGSWFDHPNHLRAFARDGLPKNRRIEYIGFRVVRQI